MMTTRRARPLHAAEVFISSAQSFFDARTNPTARSKKKSAFVAEIGKRNPQRDFGKSAKAGSGPVAFGKIITRKI
jgi:hypothetical protein